MVNFRSLKLTKSSPINPFNFDLYHNNKVKRNKTKAFAVVNTSLTANNQLGEDVFRVYGNGDVECKGLKLSTDVWADFVFKKEYDLKSLKEVESFILKNGHLPDVPDEEQILKEGIDVKKMNILLLRKIEELTLHLIEQDKKIEELVHKNE